VLDTLATAQAAAGRFAEARATERRAIALAALDGSEALLGALRERLRAFDAGQGVIDVRLAPPGAM
jgi:Flp pilus assembly protein TadD